MCYALENELYCVITFAFKGPISISNLPGNVIVSVATLLTVGSCCVVLTVTWKCRVPLAVHGVPITGAHAFYVDVTNCVVVAGVIQPI